MSASPRKASARDLRARMRVVGGSILLLGALAPAAGVPSVIASHTPDPSAVTIAGSLQSELGCAGDWQADCATTHLAYDANDAVWQATFSVPAGSWEYKAALNDGWGENYGLHGGPDNITLATGGASSVKFYYDHRVPLDHRQRRLDDRRGARQLPERARMRRRLGPRLPALVAPGRRWRRHLQFERLPCRPAPTRRRSRSTRAGTRTTARAACPTATTSRSRSRPTTPRSRSPTSPRPTS